MLEVIFLKSVVFIQSNKSGFSRDIIRECEKMNLFTILITNQPKQVKQRAEYEDVHKMYLVDDLSYANLEKFIEEEIVTNHELQTILSFIDGYITLASKLRDRFTYNPSSTNSLRVMESKILTRELFSEYEFTPAFIKIKLNHLLSKKSFSNSNFKIYN